jgi:signal transduction histidine kinase
VHATQRLTLLLAVGVPCGVLLMTAGLWVVIGRALCPLANASRRIAAIGIADLTTRVPVENPSDEVGRMVRALNGMLDRLADAVADLQRFTADAAHELRTPIAVLRAGIEVALTRERSAPEYRAALGEALDGTERLASVAEDLLTLARLEAPGAPRDVVPVPIGELLQDLTEAWRSSAAQRGVALELSRAADVSVAGVPADLYRLCSNLIDNALRNSPRGGRVCLAADPSGDVVRCTIADEGPGLSPEEQQRVFDRFYRGQNQRGNGTGLGLSIAQAIARAHGGEISLTNRPAGGCAAVLILPRAETETSRLHVQDDSA